LQYKFTSIDINAVKIYHADILDTHGDISMEIFGQNVDRLHQLGLGLDSSKLIVRQIIFKNM
jgi:hypothetical protein